MDARVRERGTRVACASSLPQTPSAASAPPRRLIRYACGSDGRFHTSMRYFEAFGVSFLHALKNLLPIILVVLLFQLLVLTLKLLSSSSGS